MKKKHKLIIALLAVSPALSVSAQGFANTGDMVVHSDAQMAVWYDLTNISGGKIIIDGTMYLHKNLTNEGAILATNLAIGETYFMGTQKQTISGNGSTTFSNAVINNSSTEGIDLSKNMHVSHIATFTDGIVHAIGADGIFIFDNGAVAEQVKDASHVNGKVSKIGKDAFTFPVGNGTYYRPASISAPSVETDAFTTQYFKKDGTVDFGTAVAGVVNVSKNEYWIIDRTAGTSTPTVTLSWDINTTSNPLPTTDLPNLIVTRWDNAKWVDESQTAKTGDATTGTLTSKVISDFSPFTLAKKDETTAIFTPTQQQIALYPNPAADFFYIELTETSTALIINTQGQVLKALDLHAGRNKIDITEFTSGMYILKVNNKIFKLIKQ